MCDSNFTTDSDSESEWEPNLKNCGCGRLCTACPNYQTYGYDCQGLRVETGKFLQSPWGMGEVIYPRGPRFHDSDDDDDRKQEPEEIVDAMEEIIDGRQARVLITSSGRGIIQYLDEEDYDGNPGVETRTESVNNHNVKRTHNKRETARHWQRKRANARGQSSVLYLP